MLYIKMIKNLLYMKLHMNMTIMLSLQELIIVFKEKLKITK